MLAKLENGKLLISMSELLEGFTTEQKREVADFLACESDIIADVASQILTGWTEASSHGFNDSDKLEPERPLGKAIRAVAEGAGTVASEQVRTLARAMARQYAYQDNVQRWAWQMYHAMQDANRDGMVCPRPPMCPSAYNTDADAWVVVPKTPAVEAGK
jgi:hypothetical protein